jgi:hypothetical protein
LRSLSNKTKPSGDDIGTLAGAAESLPLSRPAASRKRELLKWFGVVGIALTIVERLDPLLKLASLMQKAIAHWRDATHWFWNFSLGLVGIPITPELSIALNVSVFVTAIRVAAGVPRRKYNIFLNFILVVLNFIVVMALLFSLLFSLMNFYKIFDMPPELFESVYKIPIDQYFSKLFEHPIDSLKEHPVVALWIFLFMFILFDLWEADQYMLFKNLLRIGAVAMFILVLNFIATNAEAIRRALE